VRGFSRHSFTDKEWGAHVLWVPHHTESIWGVLEPVIGTPWERLFPIVDNQFIEHAIRGEALPLLNSLGRPPAKWGMALPEQERLCGERKTCPSFKPKTCWPSAVTPDCYIPLHEIPLILTQVVMRWRDGEYVLITC